MIETLWGYDINAESLPPLLSLEEFNRITLGKYASDQRACSALSAASASIRNYVGWHLASNLECVVTYAYYDLHVTRTKHGLSILLPTRFLTEVIAIEMDGVDVTESLFQVKRRGQIDLLNCPCWFKKITITFKSGLADDAGLKALVANRISNALSGPVGVASESAGGVSISYSSSYVAGSSSTALLTADKEFLNAYKIEEML